MDSGLYFYFVTALAAVYAIAVRILQNKLIDQNLVKEVQQTTKKMNELYKAAANDARKAEEIKKMNEQMMPKFNRMLMGQMKMMIVILFVFFTFTWISGHLDPTTQDDFSINLTKSENGTFSGSFILNNSNSSFWYVTVKAYNGDSELATNQTTFFVGSKSEQIIWVRATGSSMPVSLSKDIYSNGNSVFVFAQPPAQTTHTVATFNSGTRFYVDLPFTIPLLNLRRIYDSQSWFIFAAVIIGLFVNPAFSFVEKLKSRLGNAK